MKRSFTKFIRNDVVRRGTYTLEAHPEAIKLNQNELPYDLSLKLKRELLLRLAKAPLQRYPLCQPLRLQKRLAKTLAVRPTQLQFSNGSNVMIQALMMMAAVEGKVMTVEPTFTVYEIQAKLLGNRVIKVPLEGENFTFPLKKFLERMKKERPNIIFIANPNAPTGNLFPKQDLLKIVSSAKCLVVIDEAYFQFSKTTLLPYLKRFPNLVVLRTFSKGFGLGGVRVGYLVAREEIAQQVAKVLLPYCLSILSEETALFVLDRQKYFDSIIVEVLNERARMLKTMRSISGIRCYDSAANFILFRTDDSKRCFKHLLKKGVLVRDVSNKFHLKNCLRVSVGRPAENNAFLKALRSYKL
jgi:histidinol-phosphate aminotransferase